VLQRRYSVGASPSGSDVNSALVQWAASACVDTASRRGGTRYILSLSPSRGELDSSASPTAYPIPDRHTQLPTQLWNARSLTQPACLNSCRWCHSCFATPALGAGAIACTSWHAIRLLALDTVTSSSPRCRVPGRPRTAGARPAEHRSAPALTTAPGRTSCHPEPSTGCPPASVPAAARAATGARPRPPRPLHWRPATPPPRALIPPRPPLTCRPSCRPSAAAAAAPPCTARTWRPR
jgi:hypothetical protein